MESSDSSRSPGQPGPAPAPGVAARLAALRVAIDGLLEVAGEALDHTELQALVIGIERERDRLAIAAADVLVGDDTTRHLCELATAPGAIRRGIQVRDRRCTHPGCTVPADQCDVDHVVEYARRPVTDQDGGRLRCSAHNRIAVLAGHDRPPDITPRPDPTPLEHLRAKIRWRILTHWPLEPPTPIPDRPDDTAPS